jgi:hypothetical protein
MSKERDGDTATGLDRQPDRYSAHGRETIDRMRDYCYWKAEKIVALRQGGPVMDARALGDELFVAHCELTAMKYVDRLGLKDEVEADSKKAMFYAMMAGHVADDGPDPRSKRPGFVPYQRQAWMPGKG